MKTKTLLIAALVLLLAAPCFAAWSVSASSVVDSYKDDVGEHNLVKLTIVSDGSSGSVDTSDLTNVVSQDFRGYVYWYGIDPVGTLTAAPQITVTDAYGFTQFTDTTSFSASANVKVTGNSYDGQYTHISNGDVFSFNDVGDAADSFYLYLDLVR
jgi:hypothetical protein